MLVCAPLACAAMPGCIAAEGSLSACRRWRGCTSTGEGVCDIKADNVPVCVAADGTILAATLLDLGGAVVHDGQSASAPITTTPVPCLICPGGQLLLYALGRCPCSLLEQQRLWCRALL